MAMIYCRGCGKEIHEDAQACPKCGAPQQPINKIGNTQTYTSYNQVPWYRKNWYAIVCAFLFFPGLLVLLTGEIYYVRKEELKTYSKGAKFFLLFMVFAQIFAHFQKNN